MIESKVNLLTVHKGTIKIIPCNVWHQEYSILAWGSSPVALG